MSGWGLLDEKMGQRGALIGRSGSGGILSQAVVWEAVCWDVSEKGRGVRRGVRRGMKVRVGREDIEAKT